MADQYDDLDDDLDTNDNSGGPADLRKALKRAERERKALAEELENLRKEATQRTVKEVLATKGVPEKVAKFIPGDVTTPEQIDEWLKDNADVFGISFAESAPNNEPTANEVSYRRISAAVQNAYTPTRDADLLAKVTGAKSIADLDVLRGVTPNTRFSRG